METCGIDRKSNIYYPNLMPTDTCVFCGSKFGSIDFKGRCVCEECLCYVKDMM